jgi:hypothetical protein
MFATVEVEVFRRHRLTVAASQAAMLEIVGQWETDDHHPWENDGATCASMWLQQECGMSKANALEWVRIAGALRSLPAIRAAFMRGELSFDQLKPLTWFVKPEEDEIWAERATELSLGQLWRERDRRRRVLAKEAREAAQMRSLRKSWDVDRSFLHIEIELPAEEGSAVEEKLLRASEDAPLDPDAFDPEAARLADAFFAVVCGPGVGSGRPVVVVHADAAVLAGGPEDPSQPPRLCETEDGIRLAEDYVRELACDCRMEISFEVDGRPIGIGFKDHDPPPWLRRQVYQRDGGCCVWPGCQQRRWRIIHHLRPWPEGATDLTNLALLCWAHHRMVHRQGWRITGDAERMLEFLDPHGRVRYRRRARAPTPVPA